MREDDEQASIRPETDLQEGNASPDSSEDYRIEPFTSAERYALIDQGIDPDTGLPLVLP